MYTTCCTVSIYASLGNQEGDADFSWVHDLSSGFQGSTTDHALVLSLTFLFHFIHSGTCMYYTDTSNW